VYGCTKRKNVDGVDENPILSSGAIEELPINRCGSAVTWPHAAKRMELLAKCGVQ
jgi:hypothetical protein